MPDPGSELRDDVVRRMLEVARHLSGSANLTQILSVIINAMRDTLAAERATVFEYDEAPQQLVSTVAHGLDPAAGADEIRIPADSGLAGQCAQQRAIINVRDAYADDRFDRSIDKQTGFRTRSILTVPLVDDDQALIGVAQVLNKRGGPFEARDEEIALGLASLAAVAIRRGRLLEDQLVREKLQRDLQLARQIQQSTFPKQLPNPAGFEIAAWSEPAEETGGDAYDVIEQADRILLLLADATGHGIGPALSVTQLRAMLRMGALVGAPLPDMAVHMNHQLHDDLPTGKFITAWMGELNIADRTLQSFSAGQGPLLKYDAARDAFEQLHGDTLPFGVVGDLDFTMPPPIVLGEGDIFAAISDGIFEAMDAGGEEFSAARTIDVIHACRGRSAQDILAGIKEAVAAFSGDVEAADDRTAIIIKRTMTPQ
jgi:phosphoserine phosphatase